MKVSTLVLALTALYTSGVTADHKVMIRAEPWVCMSDDDVIMGPETCSDLSNGIHAQKLCPHPDKEGLTLRKRLGGGGRGDGGNRVRSVAGGGGATRGSIGPHRTDTIFFVGPGGTLIEALPKCNACCLAVASGQTYEQSPFAIQDAWCTAHGGILKPWHEVDPNFVCSDVNTCVREKGEAASAC